DRPLPTREGGPAEHAAPPSSIIARRLDRPARAREPCAQFHDLTLPCGWRTVEIFFSFQRLADENVSGSAASNSIDLDSLHSYCRTVRFEPDEALRLTGRHYRDMYLITAGEVEVRRDIGRGFAIGPGSPIGEIGFLRGCPATAPVIAKTAVDAPVVGGATPVR